MQVVERRRWVEKRLPPPDRKYFARELSSRDSVFFTTNKGDVSNMRYHFVHGAICIDSHGNFLNTALHELILDTANIPLALQRMWKVENSTHTHKHIIYIGPIIKKNK